MAAITSNKGTCEPVAKNSVTQSNDMALKPGSLQLLQRYHKKFRTMKELTI
jgi:hypothetical protein